MGILSSTKKSFGLRLEDVSEEGHFSGYANTWDVDLQNDRFMPGAFKKTIRDMRGRVPILKGHDSQVEVGMTISLSEDQTGLHIDDAQLYINNSDPKNEIAAAREEYVRMKRRLELKKPLGISVGVTVPEGKAEWVDERKGWDIKEARLWEASLTAFPANSRSQVDVVKFVSPPAASVEFADKSVFDRAIQEFSDKLKEMRPSGRSFNSDHQKYLDEANAKLDRLETLARMRSMGLI